MYYQGQGVKQNTQRALYWYTKAAKLNNPKAQYNLGVIYFNGLGIKRDILKNLRLLEIRMLSTISL